MEIPKKNKVLTCLAGIPQFRFTALEDESKGWV
jgi:hypothetical protein